MKKNLFLVLVGVFTFLLLSGCTKEEAPPKPSDLAEPITTSVEETTVVDTTHSSTEEVMEEKPPKEGMVHSTLTNEWVDEAIAKKRPICVMFPTDKGSQPQYSIGLAGVLYECMEEGEMSRQMGVIEDWEKLEQIGNIRSCRDYYAYWSMEWDSFLVHWGGPFYLVDVLKRDDMNYLSAATIGAGDKVAPAVGSSAFYRSNPSNPSIHNGYTNGEKLTAAIKQLGYETEHRDNYFVPEHFQFAPMNEANTLSEYTDAFDATEVDLSKVFPTTKSSFKYDEASGTYLKYLYGSPQIDKITDEQLSFSNIIVQDTYWEKRDAKGYLAFRVHDNSKRKAYFFTKGKGIAITWSKESDYAPTKYFDKDGNEIKLNTGHTFIAVSQEGREPIYK